MSSLDDKRKIAVIGMAGRFPGASTIDKLTFHLKNGDNLIREFTKEELLASGVSETLIEDNNYKRFCGYLEEGEYFDNELFSISNRDAKLLNPQHRIFLECCWSALENAGYAPNNVPGIVGVYAGSSDSEYLNGNLLTDKKICHECSALELEINNSKDQLAPRVSYYLNLRGPSISIQTACSTSLVAIHMACQSIILGECRMAIAGGVSIPYTEKKGYLYKEGMNLSYDGRIRSFDDMASGMVSGFGCGVVILKSLEDAIQDNDRIDAVILASSVNNDGRNKSGYSAPSVQGQIDAIIKAVNNAKVNVENIQFVEAHGSGTLLGDPIEISALKKAFYTYTSNREFCAIASIKANIGHLDAAAGVAGFIKAVLQLKLRMIFPACGFTRPNKLINFTDSPFYIPKSPINLNLLQPIVGCVNSLGIGGTNCFMVMKNYTSHTNDRYEENIQSFQINFSDQSKTGLTRQLNNLLNYLSHTMNISIKDIAETLTRRNLKMLYLLSLEVYSVQDLMDKLRVHISNQCASAEIYSTSIPKTSSKRIGKIIDLPGYVFNKHRFYVEPNIGMESTILQSQKNITSLPQLLNDLWLEVLEIKSFETKNSFFELGGHSISSIILVDKLNKYLSLNLPAHWVQMFSTVPEQLNALYQATTQAFMPIVRFRKPSMVEKNKLIFFHASASGAEAYYEIAQALDSRIDFITIDSINLHGNIPYIESIEQLVNIYIQNILKEDLSNKLYLGGWSLGGILAIEAGRQLLQKGYSIPTIFMLDSICYSNESKIFFENDNYIYFHPDFENDLNYQKLPVDYKEKLQQLSIIEAQMVMDYVITPHHHGKIINFIADNPLQNSLTMSHEKIIGFKELKKLNGWPQHFPNYEIKRINADHQNIIIGNRAKQIAATISQIILQSI